MIGWRGEADWWAATKCFGGCGRNRTAPGSRPRSGPDEPRVRYEKNDHVARTTLDRPAVLNAMARSTGRSRWEQLGCCRG